MTKEPTFTPIDRKTWPIEQTFCYYTQMAPISYTVNVELDVTTLRNTLTDKGYKFFPAYLYLVTRAISKQAELCVAVKDSILGHWNHLTPAYPQFHEDDKTTSLLWTEYTECFSNFYKQYIQDRKKHRNTHGILTSKGIPLPNSYVISCIPWFTFDSFSLHNHGIKNYFLPSFEAGGFVYADEKIYMPLSITVHHATTEGYHIKTFLEELQRTMNNTDEWL